MVRINYPVRKKIYTEEDISTPVNILEIKNRKAAQYELTSPIFYMEQYIPFSLIS